MDKFAVGKGVGQGPQRPRMVSVELAKAERKSMPVDVDAIGMVTPISSVALKSRLETTIVTVHFEDGAKVNEGDLLFTLDSRQIARNARAEHLPNVGTAASRVQIITRSGSPRASSPCARPSTGATRCSAS